MSVSRPLSAIRASSLRRRAGGIDTNAGKSSLTPVESQVYGGAFEADSGAEEPFEANVVGAIQAMRSLSVACAVISKLNDEPLLLQLSRLSSAPMVFNMLCAIYR